MGRLAASLVEATPADVAHPFDDVMVAVVQLGLEHFEVAHLEPRGSKGNLQQRRGCWVKRRKPVHAHT